MSTRRNLFIVAAVVVTSAIFAEYAKPIIAGYLLPICKLAGGGSTEQTQLAYEMCPQQKKKSPKPCSADAMQSPIDVSEGETLPYEQYVIEDFHKHNLRQTAVHWHLGAEHRSAGEFDNNVNMKEYPGLKAKVRPGYFCKESLPYLHAKQPQNSHKFEYCEDLQVGYTYEIHWSYSTWSPNGMFREDLISSVSCPGLLRTNSNAPNQIIGVQAQVYVIVDDPEYDRDDLIDGMILYDDLSIAKYTGSSTGPSYSNTFCSPYENITWHVDRKCHLISAKSFDNVCRILKEVHGFTTLASDGARVLFGKAT